MSSQGTPDELLEAPRARPLGKSGNEPNGDPFLPCPPHHPPRNKTLFDATAHRAPPTSLRMAYATTPARGAVAPYASFRNLRSMQRKLC